MVSCDAASARFSKQPFDRECSQDQSGVNLEFISDCRKFRLRSYVAFM